MTSTSTPHWPTTPEQAWQTWVSRRPWVGAEQYDDLALSVHPGESAREAAESYLRDLVSRRMWSGYDDTTIEQVEAQPAGTPEPLALTEEEILRQADLLAQHLTTQEA